MSVANAIGAISETLQRKLQDARDLGQVEYPPGATRLATTHPSTQDSEPRDQAKPFRETSAQDPAQVFIEEGDEEWSRKNILSLDGGGIRGYWSLLVLQMLMKLIAETERGEDERVYTSFYPEQLPENVSQVPLTEDQQARLRSKGAFIRAKASVLSDDVKYLPCHYFDYICGSGTGGLIAIMLARFRMTVADCLREYTTLGDQVFGKPRWLPTLGTAVGSRFKYHAWRLEDVLESMSRRRDEVASRSQRRITFATEPGVCAAFVTTRKLARGGQADELYLIRSFDNEEHSTPGQPLQPQRRSTTMKSLTSSRSNTMKSTTSTRSQQKDRSLIDVNHEKAQDLEIWEAGRAATAAPFYFKPFKLELRGADAVFKFTDGGSSHTNNPSLEARDDIIYKHGRGTIGTIVSVGTAGCETQKTHKNPFMAIPNFARSAAHRASDPEGNHRNMIKDVSDRADYTYHRFNDSGALDIGLDEWKPRNNIMKGKEKSGSKTLEKIDSAFYKWACEPDIMNLFQDCANDLVECRQARMETDEWEHFATCAEYRCGHLGCTQIETGRRGFVQHLQQRHGMVEGDEINEEVEARRKVWVYQTGEANGKNNGKR